MLLLLAIKYSGNIEWLRDQLGSRFHTKVDLAGYEFDYHFSLNPERNQYSSSSIIEQLEKDLSTAASKVLAVTELDLYMPVLTFVFGEARLNGRCAIVSSYRLDNKLYGLPEDRALRDRRLLKEAIHELGHTFGLFHCHDPVCVMKSSTYVEEIDFKSTRFCDKCLEKLVTY